MDGRLLREIPKVDELLNSPVLAQLCGGAPRGAVTDAVRAALEEVRRGILEGRVQAVPEEEKLCRIAAERLKSASLPSLRGVINGTGVVLHTNLGRACLSERALHAVEEAAHGYSTLEYDLETGSRGKRHTHVEALLQRLTGAQSALVVNNNAAAVLLILSALAGGGEVIVSRGELVEIGGSFRIPEIIESCGARLKEVGATNKTHLGDYEKAIGPDTRALMKVHTSNYRIVGFTASVSREELVALGQARGLPVIEDLGSGSLCELSAFGIQDEPTVQDSIRAGVDVVSFSGDKLLGGPQAGVILGKEVYLAKLRRHPLMRALRVDKMTLAALEATLRSYLDETAHIEVPTLAMLGQTRESLCERAQRLCALIVEKGVEARVTETEDQVGGGSVPMQMLRSYAVAVAPGARGADALEAAMRLRDRPIIGRIDRGNYLLHVRTIGEGDYACLAEALAEALL